MQNDYNNKERGQNFGKEQSTGARSMFKEETEKAQNVIENAQKQLAQAQAQAGQIVGTVDKQVHENPWPVIAGVALGSFLLGCIIGRKN